jgi:hypothetical protein
MRVDCGELDPAAVIRPIRGEWHPRMPERPDEEELADWRAGRNAVYQLAALTVAYGDSSKPPAGENFINYSKRALASAEWLLTALS